MSEPILSLDPRILVLDLRRQDRREGNSRLRIGIVTGGSSVPRWIQEFIDWFRSIADFDTRTYSTNYAASNINHSPSRLFECLYNYSRQAYDPFTEADLNPEYDVREWPRAEGNGIPGLDILIWLSPGPLPADAPVRLAKFGALSIQLGQNQHGPPYWDESAREDILSEATIWWHNTTFARARPVRRAQLATDLSIRFTQNAQQPLIAAAQMTASVCLDILALGHSWAVQAENIPETDYVAGSDSQPISTVAAARYVCRKSLRSAGLRLRRADRPTAWFLALRRNTAQSYAQSGRFTADGFRAIPLPPGAQMADPFLVEHQDRTFLYFEEIPPGTLQGRLMCAQVLDDHSLGTPSVIIESKGHISYPCVFPHRGEFFMIPESAATRRIDLYRATRFPSEFRLETTYIDDFKAVDTTPVFIDNRWYFFTSTGEPFPQTLLFWSDRLDGKWRLHPKSPVSCSTTNSRSAGAITMVQGRLLRPTQDCSVGYGYAIVLNEITRLTPSEFAERPVDTILPNWRPGLLGTHTLNSSSNFEIIDGVRYA